MVEQSVLNGEGHDGFDVGALKEQRLDLARVIHVQPMGGRQKGNASVVGRDLQGAQQKEHVHRCELAELASMHVLFLLRALEVAADDARIAFLTPAHWLDM
ncbi:MAG TPA: hypothetical protein VG106_04630, partial [Vicinamibacterales bacterium]|nr:hypothetical protein [Vicinamibacterales bacterium]